MTLRPESADAILVVDVQNDFCPGGALAVPAGDAVVPVINRLMTRFAHVLATQDWHPEGHLSFASAHAGKAAYQSVRLNYGEQVLWPDHCVQGTGGAAFHADLDTRRFELIVRKGFRKEIDSYSAFFENDGRTPTGLAGCLRDRGFGRIFIAGLALDFCVAWSALDARRLGFEVVVVEDACRGIDVDGSIARMRESMRNAGVALTLSDVIEGREAA